MDMHLFQLPDRIQLLRKKTGELYALRQFDLCGELHGETLLFDVQLIAFWQAIR